MTLSPEQREEAHEILRKAIVDIATSPTVQPDHGPHHVKSVEELQVGEEYMMHNKIGSRRIVIVRKGEETFDYVPDGKDFTREVYYTDYGMVPYEGGGITGEDTWAAGNHLERLD